MKLVGGLLTAFALGFLVDSLFVPVIFKQKKESNLIFDQSVVSNELTRQAFSLMQNGDISLSEAFWQASLQHAIKFPDALTNVWSNYKNFLEHEKINFSETEKLARAINFTKQLNSVLGACENESQIASVLSVYGDIDHYCENKAVLISGQIAKKIQKYDSNEFMKSGFADGFKEIAKCILEIEDQTKLISVATKNREVASALQKALESIPKGLNLVKSKIIKMDSEIDDLRREDSIKLAEPTGPGKGPCQLIFDELKNIEESLENLSNSSLIDTSEFLNQLMETREKSQALKLKIYQTQVVRYNLWAVSSLTNLTTDADVASTLAIIDQALLHNSVSSIYSIAYDGYIRLEKDVGIKFANVTKILSGKKKTLSDF